MTGEPGVPMRSGNGAGAMVAPEPLPIRLKPCEVTVP